jgi:hypothetical protein
VGSSDSNISHIRGDCRNDFTFSIVRNISHSNVPLAAVLHSAGEIGLAMVVAPLGSNPIENSFTAPAAIASGPV